jgi:glycosyltransferase involved in cell wall biosynthesis
MARIGNNPYKDNVKVQHRPDVSLCVVTHYENTPYHQHRMEVVKMCIESMAAGVKHMGADECELLIWDNQSTPEFRQLLGQYRPTVFVQSVNVGAHAARHALVEMASGKIVCMTDDDVLFSPDWFHLQLEVLATFPNVGLVSGTPQRTGFRGGVASTLAWAAVTPGVTVRSGKLIPDAWEQDFCKSVGRDWQKHRTATRFNMLNDTLIEYNGVRAWGHGHHMQFLAYRDVIAPFLKRGEVLLDNKHLFNVPVDDAGYLQLTTHKRTAVHIGNEIDQSIVNIQKEWEARE